MKKLQSLLVAVFCLSLVLLMCGANAAFAQEVTATIAGTITDQSGAAIAGANMSLPNPWIAASLIIPNLTIQASIAFRTSPAGQL